MRWPRPRQAPPPDNSFFAASFRNLLAIPSSLDQTRAYGACYFFMKLIRYALLFWLPYYFETVLHYPTTKANDFSNSFEIGGVVGTVVLGLWSDRVPRIPRACPLRWRPNR